MSVPDAGAPSLWTNPAAVDSAAPHTILYRCHRGEGEYRSGMLELLRDPVVLCLAVVVAIGILVIFVVHQVGTRRAIARTRRLRAYANRVGITYEPGGAPDLDERFPHLAFLRMGRSQRFLDLFTGHRGGRAFWCFDFQFLTSNAGGGPGTSSVSKTFIAVAVFESAVPLQPTAIRPEGFVDRVKAAFGNGDIDFESAAFSRRFHVSAKDRRWASHAIGPKTIECLLAHKPRVLIYGGNTLAVLSDGILDPEMIDDMLEIGTTVLADVEERSPLPAPSGAGDT